MSAQKRRASSASSESFSPLLPANVAHISRPDWQLPNSMTAPELIVFCKWQNDTWNTFSPNSFSVRLDNPVRVPSLLWLEESLHRLGLCSFSLHSCPVLCECLTKNSKERERGGTGCSLAGEGFSSEGEKHNACVRAYVRVYIFQLISPCVTWIYIYRIWRFLGQWFWCFWLLQVVFEECIFFPQLWDFASWDVCCFTVGWCSGESVRASNPSQVTEFGSQHDCQRLAHSGWQILRDYSPGTVEVWLMHEHADQNMTHSLWLPLLRAGEDPSLL